MTTSASECCYRRYAQVAAAAFLLVAGYTVIAKLPQGRLAGDWLHSGLHLLSAAAAVYAGWRSRSPRPARLFTLAVALVYAPLGVVGGFTPGFFFGTVAALPLTPADNVFHLLLAVPALALAATSAQLRRRLLLRASLR